MQALTRAMDTKYDAYNQIVCALAIAKCVQLNERYGFGLGFWWRGSGAKMKNRTTARAKNKRRKEKKLKTKKGSVYPANSRKKCVWILDNTVRVLSLWMVSRGMRTWKWPNEWAVRPMDEWQRRCEWSGQRKIELGKLSTGRKNQEKERKSTKRRGTAEAKVCCR